jgi:hypothetical protein
MLNLKMMDKFLKEYSRCYNRVVKVNFNNLRIFYDNKHMKVKFFKGLFNLNYFRSVNFLNLSVDIFEEYY